jgi:hypothetical protein
LPPPPPAARPPSPAASVAAPAPPPAAVRPTRLALEVAGTVLGGLSGDLVTEGLTLGMRLPLAGWLDLRLRSGLLRPTRHRDHDGRYDRDLLPVDLMMTTTIPGLPGLRAGAGIGALHAGDDEAGAGSVWAPGVTGRVEYRRAVGSFAVVAGLEAAWRPRLARVTTAPDARFEVPAWVAAACLGMEFAVF